MTGVASTAKRRSLITILILLQCSYAIPPPRRGHVPRPRKRQNVQMVVDESTGETKEWTPAVSLELFEQRKQHGPPLTRRDRHHEVALRRQVMQQYYDDKREAERLIEEAKKPRKPHPLLCGTHHCIVAGLKVHLETSGAYPYSGDFDWVCMSPKKMQVPLKAIKPITSELKVIVNNKHDFIWAEQQRAGLAENCKLYLQPEWSKRKQIIPLIIDFVKENKDWTISLQSHKYMNIP